MNSTAASQSVNRTAMPIPVIHAPRGDNPLLAPQWGGLSPWWRRLPRLAVRLAGFAALVAGAMADYGFRIWTSRAEAKTRLRTEWLSRWSRRALRVLHVRSAGFGMPPASGVLVCNHLGYLDILLLAAAKPCIFVAKTEVGNWPLVGRLARMGGTLFVRRDHWADLPRLNAEFAQPLAAGHVVAVFPEGTSTDGHRVLPFHSALLAPVAAVGGTATPAWIGYALEAGSVEDDVCYWRDMVFLPHFLKLLTKREIRACLVFGDALIAPADRKRLAKELHARVLELGDAGRRLLEVLPRGVRRHLRP